MTIEQKKIIKTVYETDQEIIQSILELHIKDDRFDIDPTYSTGRFYKGLNEPRRKFDLYPQTDDTEQASSVALPITDKIHSICFDPPFLAGYTTGKQTGIIGERFNGFRYMPDVWQYYKESLREFARILEDGGFVAFKCQDTVSSGKQWWSHVYIMNEAPNYGFYVKDLFIQVAKNRMIGHNHKKQKHARKFHSYWLVLELKDKKKQTP